MNNLPSARRSVSPTVALAFWVGLFLFAIYLLSFSGKFHVMDELAVFTAGHSLAGSGRADIDLLIWTNHWTPNPPGVWGGDGHLYTKKAPGISFLVVPLIWLGQTLPGLNAVHVGLLINAIVTALTAGLLLLWLTDLGFSRRIATLTALVYGLGTIAWVYARMFWESSLLALFFLIAIWAAYRGRATGLLSPARRLAWVLLAGAAGAVGLTLRFEAAVALILVGCYLLWEELRRPGNAVTFNGTGLPFTKRFAASLPVLVIYALPALVVALGLVWFNLARFGSLTETGYSRELLFRAPWVGSFGLLFSPGRGLFIFSPIMLLLFLGLRPAWRRLPRAYFWLVAAICLFYWLFYGSWFAWGGAWGWGPRFLLPILPLLMLFVAEPLTWAGRQVGWRAWLAWSASGGLMLLSMGANVLGVAVDFNEHFLRLGRNDDFVFNWAVMPLLGHWQILQEGLVDLIWLQPQDAGLTVVWPVLLPPLLLALLAGCGLLLSNEQSEINNEQLRIRNEELEMRNEALNHPTGSHLMPPSSRTPHPAPRSTPHAPRFTLHVSRFILHPSALIPILFLALLLTFIMLRGAARLPWLNPQAQADLPVLNTLTRAGQPGDALLAPMPPFGDVQEISTWLMAYLKRPLPLYGWIESEPRSIQPDERERVRQAVEAEAGRVWLFERWLTPADPLTASAAYFNRQAFPVSEQWFSGSGRLTLFALPAQPTAAIPPVALNVPFAGGLTLLDFAVLNHQAHPGELLKVRLTWQSPAVGDPGVALPHEAVISFVHLLAENEGGQAAQQDRLLLDLQNFGRSPLLPGQTVTQGYGLQLPPDLPAGSYPLIAGLYLASSGQRLSRSDGSPDDFIYLTNVVVSP